MAIVIALRRIDLGWKVVLVGGLAGGMLEFAMSLIQQYLLGSRSWNYANEPLNIGGRTTVPFMLFWGLLCYLIVRFILPLVLWLVHLIDDTWHTRLATILLAWILIDAVGALPAIDLPVRAARQRRGVRQLVRAAYRAAFDDDFMRLHFPNMRV